MEKDFASLILGIVAIFFILLFGQDAVLSLVCAAVSIIFGILSMRSGGKKKFYYTGMGLSLMAILMYIFPRIV